MADDVQEDLEQSFKLATEYVKRNAGRLSANRLLYLYGRFKQAKEGPCKTPKPGLFDFQGKQKWEAWKKLGKMSAQTAMLEYINCVLNEDPNCLRRPEGPPPEEEEETGEGGMGGGLGVAVSTMCKSDSSENLRAEDKTVFDWCKECDLDKVKAVISSGQTSVNEKDAEGLTLLHWACDRGLTKMVELLLSLQANVNAQEDEGQTPLHYAVYCDHEEVVRLLLSHGAKTDVQAEDGSSPLDVASENMRRILTGS